MSKDTATQVDALVKAVEQQKLIVIVNGAGEDPELATINQFVCVLLQGFKPEERLRILNYVWERVLPLNGLEDAVGLARHGTA
jgi:hypothetical protein